MIDHSGSLLHYSQWWLGLQRENQQGIDATREKRSTARGSKGSHIYINLLK